MKEKFCLSLILGDPRNFLSELSHTHTSVPVSRRLSPFSLHLPILAVLGLPAHPAPNFPLPKWLLFLEGSLHARHPSRHSLI